MLKKIQTPISNNDITNLKVGDKLLISGIIFTGRDEVLPKLKEGIFRGLKDDLPFDLEGSVIMHTAVSVAGISPTTSNKKEIESTLITLAKKGVKIHIGKGSLSDETKRALNNENSIFVVTPTVNALLNKSVKSKKVIAYEEEGMGAVFRLETENIPGIVVIAHGKSIY